MATRVVSGLALFVIIGISVLLGAIPFGIILLAISVKLFTANFAQLWGA